MQPRVKNNFELLKRFFFLNEKLCFHHWLYFLSSCSSLRFRYVFVGATHEAAECQIGEWSLPVFWSLVSVVAALTSAGRSWFISRFNRFILFVRPWYVLISGQSYHVKGSCPFSARKEITNLTLPVFDAGSQWTVVLPGQLMSRNGLLTSVQSDWLL